MPETTQTDNETYRADSWHNNGGDERKNANFVERQNRLADDVEKERQRSEHDNSKDDPPGPFKPSQHPIF